MRDDATASDLRYRELAGQTTPATSTTGTIDTVTVLLDSISVIAVCIPPDGES